MDMISPIAKAPTTTKERKHEAEQALNGNGNADLVDMEGGEEENDMMASLPKEVVRRVNALKNIQLKMVDAETKFYEELHLLECKYANVYEAFYAQREKIVNGEHEPNDDEARFELDGEVEQLADDVKNKAKLLDDADNKDKDAENAAESVKGIPDFWLHAMKSTDILGSAIQEHDEPILQHLRDIRVRMKSEKPFGYTIEFHFAPNEYFTNTLLTKTYELTTDKDERDPFGYDGPALYKSVGCAIDWCKGKDVTVRVVRKKQKHKSTGTIRVVSKEEKQDSFFNFFESPTPDGIRPSYKSITSPSQFNNNNLKKKKKNDDDDSGQVDADDDRDEDDDEMNDEDEELYEADFEIGHFLKEFLIPKAVLYYTGELIDEGGQYDDEDEYDDDEAAGDDAADDDDAGDNGHNDDEEDEEQGNRKNKKQQQQGKSKSPKL